MIVGAAILPTAPLLVPGASASLPPGAEEVCEAIDRSLDQLPDHDVAVLVAAGRHGSLYDAADASLAPVGLPHVRQRGSVDGDVLERLSGLVQYQLQRGERLPLDLSVLALLVGDARPVVPVEVPLGAAFDALTAVGVGIATACEGPDLRAVVVAAGDLSAGLGPRSPLHEVDGAAEFDHQVLDVVDQGRLEGLSRLGPGEARRVGARGWAAMAVLHGALARAKVGIVRRHYSSPRGVGYLVAHGA
jgi:hypothetical protein